MDAYDRKINEENIRAGIARLRDAKSYGVAVSARALIAHGIDAEIRRLKEKGQRLLRAEASQT